MFFFSGAVAPMVTVREVVLKGVFSSRDKGLGCHEVISLLGGDYHFSSEYTDHVCMGL
jgi:hypothetical protein